MMPSVNFANFNIFLLFSSICYFNSRASRLCTFLSIFWDLGGSMEYSMVPSIRLSSMSVCISFDSLGALQCCHLLLVTLSFEARGYDSLYFGSKSTNSSYFGRLEARFLSSAWSAVWNQALPRGEGTGCAESMVTFLSSKNLLSRSVAAVWVFMRPCCFKRCSGCGLIVGVSCYIT